MQQLPTALLRRKAAGRVCAVRLTASQASWTVRIDEDHCTIDDAACEPVDVQIAADDDTLVEVMTGQASAVWALRSGRLKVTGDLLLAADFIGYFDLAPIG